MTGEKRHLKEQIATHIYRRPTSPAAGNYRQRVVTRPGAVQPSAGERYVERRNRLYSARASQQQTYTDMMPRTLARTGTRASNSQHHLIKRSLPQYHSSPIPRRSGLHNGQHRQRGGFLWKILGMFVFFALIILGANFALTSTAFRVAQVTITGTHNPILVQSIQHMGMQDQNIFLIDVATLTTRIDLLPMVASANLEKQWPNQLQVTITERTPVLLWQTKHGTYSVDKYGVVIAPASETTGADALMTVVDMRTCGGDSCGRPRGQSIHPGDRLNQADIAFAMAVFERLPKVVGITDYTLRYDGSMPGSLGGDGAYVVESKTGWLAYLGGAHNVNPLDNRLVELQQILALAQQHQLNLATVDLRFGLRPVYTLKS